MISSEHGQADRRFFTRWVLATFAGYCLGFVLTILGAIAGDLIGMPESQFIVGIGMGAGVGFAQGRAARKWLGATIHWVWTTVIGMGVAFVVFDLVAAVWSEFSDVLSLQLDVIFGGLLVGLLQRRILRSHSDKANWWVPACVAAWSLAAWTASVTPAGGQNAFLNLGMILFGGVVLGVVTGGALVWIRRHGAASH
ncbi:MAG: hypothetical protein KAT30_10615 [Candidatus Krumholzibacteria bacterium]|nr:hypothetical protein [Candidatus Krumholzibacteria bacterium]MCK5618953.1 hypothetical protein [Candidatus Krumholzibacteria bacterium]